MASIPCVLIVLLICLSQDHMGVQGKIPSVFSSVGENATLPCSNVVNHNCSSTTWLSSSSGTTVELFAFGKIKPAVATHRAKRLSLVSNCSLHITDVTTEDAGVYDCQQYLTEDGPRHGEGAPVYLSVLQAKSTPPPTDSGKPGVIPTTSSTSVSKSSPRTKTVTTASSTSGPSATKSSPPPTDSDVLLVAGVVVSVSLLAAALMIVVICKRRTNAGGEPRHKSTQSSAIVMQSVQPPISSANEEGADLHYAAFQHLNPTQAGPSAKQSEDTVTYSTIMQLFGGEDQNSSRPAGRPADPNAMYATVQKNNKIQN